MTRKAKAGDTISLVPYLRAGFFVNNFNLTPAEPTAKIPEDLSAEAMNSIQVNLERGELVFGEVPDSSEPEDVPFATAEIDYAEILGLSVNKIKPILKSIVENREPAAAKNILLLLRSQEEQGNNKSGLARNSLLVVIDDQIDNLPLPETRVDGLLEERSLPQ